MNRRNFDRLVKTLGPNNFVTKNGNQQQTSFRVPDYQYFQNHPQALSYSSVVKGQISPKASSTAWGNEPAAAAQPLTRGGDSNQTWGQHMNQIQMITKIVLQCLKRSQ